MEILNVYIYEGELIFRSEMQNSQLILEDTQSLNKINNHFKYLQKKFLLPAIVAILVLVPVPPKASASEGEEKKRGEISLNRMHSYGNKKEFSPTSSLQKGSMYKDSLTGEIFEIRFHTIDFRSVKNVVIDKNLINIQVTKIPWSKGPQLYAGLVLLEENNRTFNENKKIIDYIFKKNIEQGTTTFQIRRTPLKGRLLGGSQEPQQAMQAVILEQSEPVIIKTKNIRSSILLLGGVLLLGTGGVALGAFYAQQRKELTALRVLYGQQTILYDQQTNDVTMLGKILGLFLRKGGYHSLAKKMYKKAFQLSCDKSLFVLNDWLPPFMQKRFIFPGIYELCRNLESLQLLDILVTDQIRNGPESKSPTLLYILKPILDKQIEYFTELYKQYNINMSVPLP